jgi:hypothetical protein
MQSFTAIAQVIVEAGADTTADMNKHSGSSSTSSSSSSSSAVRVIKLKVGGACGAVADAQRVNTTVSKLHANT